MKLKQIPSNTVVHTPTEAEAKELLAILHENGYEWYASNKDEKGWQEYQDQTCYRIDSENSVYHKCDKLWYETICQYCILPSLTLAEFKERYCDFDDTLTDVCKSTVHVEKSETSTKDETKEPVVKENLTTETKELNLCELLKGHEGEKFYSPICGIDIELKTIFKSFLMFYLDKDDDCTIECETRGWQRIGTLNECGVFKSITYPDSACLIYPSRALYEQYPLDPYAAWMEWQAEQKKYDMHIQINTTESDCFSESELCDTLYFRTTADRDKCIEVIDAFLKQIQQSNSVASLCEEIKAIIDKYRK